MQSSDTSKSSQTVYADTLPWDSYRLESLQQHNASHSWHSQVRSLLSVSPNTQEGVKTAP